MRSRIFSRASRTSRGDRALRSTNVRIRDAVNADDTGSEAVTVSNEERSGTSVRVEFHLDRY